MAKYAVEFDKSFDDLISNLVRSETNPAKNKSDTIARAVALYSYLHKELENNPNAAVALLDKTTQQVLLIIDPLP